MKKINKLFLSFAFVVGFMAANTTFASDAADGLEFEFDFKGTVQRDAQTPLEIVEGENTFSFELDGQKETKGVHAYVGLHKDHNWVVKVGADGAKKMDVVRAEIGEWEFPIDDVVATAIYLKKNGEEVLINLTFKFGDVEWADDEEDSDDVASDASDD